jgi:peptidoglycan/LPS O-acetylase OafA/YrhL
MIPDRQTGIQPMTDTAILPSNIPIAEAESAPRLPWRKHLPALDGVRGLAILLVMFFHMVVATPVRGIDRLWAWFASQGGCGVDVFFALSGFLITGILIDAKGSPSYFRNFYARRALRIFPLYYAVVAFCLLILPHIPFSKAAKFGSVGNDAIYYWTYLSNFAIAARGKFVHGILDVSWSLAIEEQFYLIWPTVVLLVSSVVLKRICIALIAISCLLSMALQLKGVNPIAIYTLTFTRMDGLAIGALTAVMVRQADARRWLRAAQILGMISAALLIGIWAISSRTSAIALVETGFGHALVACATACAIFLIVLNGSPKVEHVFSNSLLRTLGKYSYALYLFHYPLMAVVRDAIWPKHFPKLFGSVFPEQILFVVVGSTVSFAAAWLSWNLFEKHFLKLKRYFELAPTKKALSMRAVETVAAP